MSITNQPCQITNLVNKGNNALWQNNTYVLALKGRIHTNSETSTVLSCKLSHLKHSFTIIKDQVTKITHWLIRSGVNIVPYWVGGVFSQSEWGESLLEEGPLPPTCKPHLHKHKKDFNNLQTYYKSILHVAPWSSNGDRLYKFTAYIIFLSEKWDIQIELTHVDHLDFQWITENNTYKPIIEYTEYTLYLYQNHQCSHGCCRGRCYWGSSWLHTSHHCYSGLTYSHWGGALQGPQTSAPQMSSSHRPEKHAVKCRTLLNILFTFIFNITEYHG